MGSLRGTSAILILSTENRFSFEHGDGYAVKISFTIWKDLGQGPDSEEWKAHFPIDDSLPSLQPIQFPRGKIASVFESGEPLWAGDEVSYFS